MILQSPIFNLLGAIAFGLYAFILIKYRKRLFSLRGWQQALLILLPVVALVVFGAVRNSLLEAKFRPFQAYLGEYTAATEYQRGATYVRGKIIPVNIRNNTIDQDFYDALPAELRAGGPEEVGTVMWLDCTADMVGTYTHGGGAYRWNCAVKVIDLSLSKILEEKTFFGSDPPGTNSGSTDQFGSYPSGQIIAYLAALPRK